jgi:hypothetical protein
MTILNKRAVTNRRYAVGFSVVGSLVSILLFVFINYSTSGGFPWFIYPTFAVLWWPMGVIFAGKPKLFSLFGSLAIIVLLFLTNYLTSWNHPWFLYPSFAVIWWPLAVYFAPKRARLFSLIGALSIIAFSIVTNYTASPAYTWFYYPSLAVILWPLSVFLGKPRTSKIYSVICSLYILALLIADNLINTPSCPWVLLTVFPLVIWPVCVFLEKRTLRLWISLAFSAAGIVYYTLLNMFVFPGFPWVIFPAYGLIWWPLTIAFAKRGRVMLFSLCGTLLSAALFIEINIITSPHTIWAIYPIFALVWWPLATYFFVYKSHKIKSSGN